MRIKTKVTLKEDTKVWQRIRRNLTRGAGQKTQTGWFEGNIHPTGVPTAQVAAWNEDGHYNGPGSAFPGSWSPSRPFMTQGFIPQSVRTIPQYFPLVNRVALGQISWKQMHEQMGMKFKTLLQDIIEGWNSPPNSLNTVALKGSNDPLIDSGHMINTAGYRVRRG